jgi:hypothetical protein
MDLSLEMWCEVFGDVQILDFVHGEFIRLLAFCKLQLTHTCCDAEHNHLAPRISEVDRLEIQEEEREIIRRLDIFIEMYDAAFAAHKGPIRDLIIDWEERIFKNDGEFLWSFDLEES